MKMQWFISALIAAGSSMTSSCTHYYYLPNSHNVPLLTQKNDVRFSLAKYTGSDGSTSATGIEIQGSYAVTNKIGVLASYMEASSRSGVEYGGGQYGEVGGGYFVTDRSKHFVFEGFGVIGYGGAENRFSSYETGRVNFTKLSLQPILGYKSKYFDAAFSWRLSSLRYSSIGYEGTMTANGMSSIQDLQARPSLILSEPAITMRLGFDAMKIQLQTGWSNSVSGPGQSRIHGSIGFFFTFNAGTNGK